MFKQPKSTVDYLLATTLAISNEAMSDELTMEVWQTG
jgi:hypothetical protein